MRARLNANYGKGVVEIDDWFEGEDILTKLRSVFQSPTYEAPQLPQVAIELLQMSQDPEVSLDQVRKVLEKDAMLCGEVLRIVQSPLYAGRVRVQSIGTALSRLGLNTVRDIVLQVATKSRVFRAKAYQKPMDQLRGHGTAVAVGARIICRYTAFDADYAFLCGLLHDVGKAGALVAMAEGTRTPPQLADIWHAIEEVHAEASEVMVRQWKLPEEVALVIGAHHTVRIQGYPHPLAAAVALADRFATDLGFCVKGVTAPNGVGGMTPEAMVEILQLTPKQLDLIRDDVEKALAL